MKVLGGWGGQEDRNERIKETVSNRARAVKQDQKQISWFTKGYQEALLAKRELVTYGFKSSLPHRITSELKETFIKRYIVERTKKAEIIPKEQSEKVESCWENLWNEIQSKGP